jgi:hypothetical protein
MSNEEFERKMAFIIEQQAQFAADIQQVQATQAQTENVVGRLANATLAGFNDVNLKIDALVDSQIRTDETLRNLIAAVDRYFSEGRNGK